MNIGQINSNLENLILNFNPESFIYDLLLAYGTPRATIARVQLATDSLTSGEAINNSNPSETNTNSLTIRKKVVYRATDSANLQTTFSELRTNDKVRRQEPRFIVVTDFETLLAVDTKTTEVLDIPLVDINRHFDFFLPWAGMEKHKIAQEQEADLKAADRMAKLYDEICKTNPTETPEQVHNLNVFLSRLLFCFFAEDTDIFEKNLFTNSIDSHTQTDGSDVNAYLDTLFEVMNTDYKDRNRELPEYLKVFPYVNGGLFRNTHAAPVFTNRSRRMLIEAGSLQWSDINPDIFGSMIQAVVTPEHRGGLGMHYTSVPNIMKVIEPLFLNELREEFNVIVETRRASSQNLDKSVQTRHATSLHNLLKRIWKIKIFDPACGSGNFLIIAYKKLRELEMDIFNELGTFAFSEINLDSFYGIELDDFAHEVATLSLWLAEHQMNQVFKARFGDVKPALPLKQTGNIVHGNACRMDWETVCPKTINGGTEPAEVYILGNPPYIGAKLQNLEQRSDLAHVFNGVSDFKNLDYISCWLLISANYILNTKYEAAFVSTKSIIQGNQVGLLWPNLYKHNVEIGFAHKPFKWTNSAKDKAGVQVIVLSIRNINDKKGKYIYSDIKKKVQNIGPYLNEGSSLIISSRRTSISGLPEMVFGNMPLEGNYLKLSEIEKMELVNKYPNSVKFIRPLIGGDELINGIRRFCIWIEDEHLNEALEIPFIKDRIEKVRDFRINGGDVARTLVYRSHQFRYRKVSNEGFIIIPCTTSDRRNFMQCGFFDSTFISIHSAQVIYDSKPYIFSILSCNMHMLWVKAVGGYLGTSIRYSTEICYNTFPFPQISDKQKQELEQHTYNIISEREQHSEKTLAELYDPDKMPDGLREAHRLNDLAVERCYRSRPFESDEERLEYLFKLYEQMIAEEKERGTLFEGEKKKKTPKPRSAELTSKPKGELKKKADEVS